MIFQRIQMLFSKLKVASKKKLIKFTTLDFPNSKAVLWALYKAGFILGYTAKYDRTITVYLRYDSYGVPIIRDVLFISKNNNAIYIQQKQMNKILHKYTFTWGLVRTQKGFFSITECYKNNMGGEFLAVIN